MANVCFSTENDTFPIDCKSCIQSTQIRQVPFVDCYQGTNTECGPYEMSNNQWTYFWKIYIWLVNRQRWNVCSITFERKGGERPLVPIRVSDWPEDVDISIYQTQILKVVLLAVYINCLGTSTFLEDIPNASLAAGGRSDGRRAVIHGITAP